MDEKTTRTVEAYSAYILRKMVDLEKVSSVLKDENATEPQKIKAISKYFTTTDTDYNWSSHSFIESLGEEL